MCSVDLGWSAIGHGFSSLVASQRVFFRLLAPVLSHQRGGFSRLIGLLTLSLLANVRVSLGVRLLIVSAPSSQGVAMDLKVFAC